MADDNSEAPAAAEERGRGRPTKYDPAFAKQAAKLCRMGATDADLADFFEVSLSSIEKWAAIYPEFLRARKVGKAEADERVKRSLYQRAVGYQHDAVKFFTVEGEVVREDYVERYPPDTAACIFWLKNRDKQNWKEKHEVEHGVTGEVADLLRAIDGATRGLPSGS